MVEVLVNVTFIDKYTGELYKAGDKVTMTKERAKEVQDFVVKGFITVLGEVEEKPKAKATKEKAK